MRIDSGEGSLNTEGAIAKYMATEAGNAAADDKDIEAAAPAADGSHGIRRSASMRVHSFGSWIFLPTG